MEWVKLTFNTPEICLYTSFKAEILLLYIFPFYFSGTKYCADVKFRWFSRQPLWFFKISIFNFHGNWQLKSPKRRHFLSFYVRTNKADVWYSLHNVLLLSPSTRPPAKFHFVLLPLFPRQYVNFSTSFKTHICPWLAKKLPVHILYGRECECELSF